MANATATLRAPVPPALPRVAVPLTHGSLPSRLAIATVLITTFCLTFISTAAAQTVPPVPLATITNTPYHGWTNSIILANPLVEAVIVPGIGRVMQFQFKTNAGPFWENPKLSGRGRLADPSKWSNFGGDKSWPAPQDEWPRMTGIGWPPPTAFDATTYTATISPAGVTIVSPVDSHYGIRVSRQIALDPQLPRLTIDTTFEKVSGTNVNVAVWTITQLQDPVGVYLPAPTNGVAGISGNRPPNLWLDEDRIFLQRDQEKSYKIGVAGEKLLWVGKTNSLLIEIQRVAGAVYPDQNTSSQVYTNPDEAPYVELELLGPLSKMAIGDKKSLRTTFTLYPRTEFDPSADARAIFKK